jgi:hypothetical protein
MSEWELAQEYKWVLWIGGEPMYGNDYQYMVRQARAYGLGLSAIHGTSAGLEES